MEATGVYHERMATELPDAGFWFSLANPHRSREFACGTGCSRKHFRQHPVNIPARAGFWSSLYVSVPDGTAGSLASDYGCRWLARHRATLRAVIPSYLPAEATPAGFP